MTSFQTKQTVSVLGISNNARCQNRVGAHLVSQREEIIVEPESTHASKEALDPVLSISGLDYKSPTTYFID